MMLMVAVACGGNGKKSSSEAEAQAVALTPADQAISLVHDMINAAKADDVAAFKAAFEAANALYEELSEKENEEIEKKMEKEFSESDLDVIDSFIGAHYAEIVGEFDFDDDDDDEIVVSDDEDDYDVSGLYDEATEKASQM